MSRENQINLRFTDEEMRVIDALRSGYPRNFWLRKQLMDRVNWMAERKGMEVVPETSPGETQYDYDSSQA